MTFLEKSPRQNKSAISESSAPAPARSAGSAPPAARIWPHTYEIQPAFVLLLTAVANRLTANSIKLCLEPVRIGMAEWRVLSSIAELGDATGAEICAHTGMDKAGVSRALKSLTSEKALNVLLPFANRRGARFNLSPSGIELERKVFLAAWKLQDSMLRGISASERHTLFTILRKIFVNSMRDPG